MAAPKGDPSGWMVASTTTALFPSNRWMWASLSPSVIGGRSRAALTSRPIRLSLFRNMTLDASGEERAQVPLRATCRRRPRVSRGRWPAPVLCLARTSSDSLGDPCGSSDRANRTLDCAQSVSRPRSADNLANLRLHCRPTVASWRAILYGSLDRRRRYCLTDVGRCPIQKGSSSI
jgi:hypothetical protein